MIDLHIHTTISDGELSPSEIVNIAKQRGVETIAITDHDTTEGVNEAYKEGQRLGVRVIPGIEFSSKDKYVKKIHILGYNIDYKNPELIAIYKEYIEDRIKRNNEFINKFNALGINITLQDVRKYVKNDNIRKPEFAKALLEKGYIKEEEEAYIRYLNQEPFKSIKRQKAEMSPREVISIIKKYGGIAVLAHPYTLELEEKDLEKKILEYKDYGLDGLECFHSRQTLEQMELYEKLAYKYDLIITIGSDFHGPNIHPEIEIGTGKNNNIVNCRTRNLDKILK